MHRRLWEDLLVVAFGLHERSIFSEGALGLQHLRVMSMWQTCGDNWSCFRPSRVVQEKLMSGEEVDAGWGRGAAFRMR